jgi:plastocyanin
MITRLLAITALLVLLGAACGDDDEASPTTTTPPGEVTDLTEPTDDPDTTDASDPSDDATITVAELAFTDVEIVAGGTVTWVNETSLPHTLTSASGPTEFDEPLDGGATVTLTFDQPGTYEYFCSIHPTMAGTIVVVG